MINSDFHTHTIFCDGRLIPDEMVRAAINKGMDAIGFSGHSHTPFDESYCMSKENTENYKKVITKLKTQYSDRIEIYLGIERDYFSDLNDFTAFDYIISAVHFVNKDGKYLAIDESEELFKKNVSEYYDGDYFSFCEDYYNTLKKSASLPGADIIAHFDLIMKFNEEDKLFDSGNKRYVSAVNEALYVLAAKDKIIEINTGAISRGYRSMPYPMEDILIKWHKLGGRIIFSGDAHDDEGLCYKFDDAERLAAKCGFNEAVVFKNGELVEVPLNYKY